MKDVTVGHGTCTINNPLFETVTEFQNPVPQFSQRYSQTLQLVCLNHILIEQLVLHELLSLHFPSRLYFIAFKTTMSTFKTLK